MKKATRLHTKGHNRVLVLRTIYDRSSISRADIARATGLTRTTVSEIVSALIDEGLVSEVGIGESQGGKSPILISLDENSRYLIGLDLAQSEFRGAVVSLRGKLCATISTPLNGHSGQEAIELVYKTLDELLSLGHSPLIGIGVGAPGLVDSQNGVVINAVNLDWQGLPLADLLRDRYKLPVFVLNDSQAAALGEFTFGQDMSADGNLIAINARHGLGAGIVIKGHLFPGDGGGAGEIGHFVVEPEGGELCRCGNYGCLETVASVKALIQKAQLLREAGASSTLVKARGSIDLKLIDQAYKAGDLEVKQIVDRTAYYMGVAISALVSSVNIQKIVLLGDMTCFGAPWLNTIRQTVAATTLSRLARNTQVEIGQLGRDSIVLGASAMLANNFSLLFMRQSFPA